MSDLERGARRAPYRDTAERLAAAPGLDGAERAALPRATTRRSGPRPLEQPVSSRFASLPSSLSSFVGRERERAEVRRLLAETRLLTLVGAGGVGKTRLALVVAEELRAMAGTSVGFVDLAPLADPQLVPTRLRPAVAFASGAGTVQRQHAEFFLALALEVGVGTIEPATNERAANGWTMAQAMAALDREYGNLRAALKWLLEQSALVESAQRLAGVFGRFCFIRGYPAEGEARLKQALAAQGGDRPTM